MKTERLENIKYRIKWDFINFFSGMKWYEKVFWVLMGLVVLALIAFIILLLCGTVTTTGTYHGIQWILPGKTFIII